MSKSKVLAVIVTMFCFCTLANSQKPQIVLKLDDLWNEDRLVHPGWEQVIEYLNKEGVTATVGVVCESLSDGSESYLSWIKERENEGHEIWHHGYCHCKPVVEQEEKREFRGTSPDFQRENMQRAHELGKERLDITFRTFGAPYNSTDANTAVALDEIDEIKVWLYKETDAPTEKYVIERIPEVNIEYPVHIPDFEQFKSGYQTYQDQPVLVIQGHPRSWVEDPSRFDEFKKIIEFLLSEGVRFTTPYQYYLEAKALEEVSDRVLRTADEYLDQQPVPITAYSCERSAGGLNDFYSEGDYWWPDPQNPDGPYVRRDGQSNPENFTAHREAMRDFGRWVGALTAAYVHSGDEKYAEHAVKHLRTWLVNEETMMAPNLLYAQAIKGRVTGRGIGIIDGIHLVEVAQSIKVLNAYGALSEADYKAMRGWFASFVEWLTTHQYGIDERDHGNNHSTWWAAQVAVYADMIGRDDLILECLAMGKRLLEEQMDQTGGFPEELERTKPYNYSLFNLEAYSLLAHVTASKESNLWSWQGEEGGLRDAWDYMYPAVADKSKWTLPPDVEHFDELPIQSTGLLLAALAWQDEDMLDTWMLLSPEPQSKEIDRTYPVRNPILWMGL